MQTGSLNLDLIIFTIATGLDAKSAMNTVRIGTYEEYARQLRGNGKVLIVTDCVTTLPEFLALFVHPRCLTRRVRKQRLAKIYDNLFTYAPVLPLPLSLWEKLPSAVRGLLGQAMGWGLRRALTEAGFKGSHRVTSVNDPRLHFAPGLANESVLVYECLDDYALYGWETKPDKVRERERSIVRRANVVFTTARSLYDRMRAQHDRVHYFPNAVDFDFFNQATLESTPVAPLLSSVPRPIIGFMGNLTSWYNFALLQSVIEARPEWSFVFIGWADSRPEIDLIRGMPNVWFFGTREFGELPSFLKGFDVAIMPYDLKAAGSVNPDKMYQYMAAGVPVVSTPIPEVAQYSKVIHLAADTATFLRAIETCLSQHNGERIKRQIAIAREETWYDRVAGQLKVMREAIAGGSGQR